MTAAAAGAAFASSVRLLMMLYINEKIIPFRFPDQNASKTTIERRKSHEMRKSHGMGGEL